jgi:hypothetical protein
MTNLLRLNFNLSSLSVPPLIFLDGPLYSIKLTPKLINFFNIEAKFHTNILNSISYNEILNIITKNFPNANIDLNNFQIIKAELFISIYDYFQNNKCIKTLAASLNGAEYVYTAKVPKNGYWRQAIIFNITVSSNGNQYNIRLVDDRDYFYKDQLFSSEFNPEYPFVGYFSVLFDKETLTTPQYPKIQIYGNNS